jgi:hypothetical protein
MSDNLLEAPERGAIEAVLLKGSDGFSQAPTFERLLGFLSGAVLTPGGLSELEWLQPVFDLNGVALKNLEDIEVLTASLVSLYDRVDVMMQRKERLCPFDLNNPEILTDQRPVMDWATGLHHAVTWQEDLWIAGEDEDDFIDEMLKNEVNLNIQCLTTLVDPASVPQIVKDPIPFQRNVVAHFPDWREDMLRETWDDELLQLFHLFCFGRLDAIMDSLQRYSIAYDEGAVVDIDFGETTSSPDRE